MARTKKNAQPAAESAAPFAALRNRIVGTGEVLVRDYRDVVLATDGIPMAIALGKRRSETLISPQTTPTTEPTAIAQNDSASVTSVPCNM